MGGGEHCRPAARHQVQHRVAFISNGSGKSEVVAADACISARSNVGRARHGTQSRKCAAASKTPMVFACTCPQNARLFQPFARDASPWMVSTSSFVESVGRDRAVKSLRKPWMSSFRWNACEHAYSSRCARDSPEDAPVPNAGPSRSVHIVPKRMCRAPRRRALCVKASMQSLLYISKLL